MKKSTYYRHLTIIKEGQRPRIRKEGIIPGYSYNKAGEKVNDLKIQKFISEIKADICGKHYGYKKVTAVLKRAYNLIINKKKVYRLMDVMGILKPDRRKPTQYKRVCKNHKISGSNQLWEMDTKYIFIGGMKKVAYLATIIDVFDRSILAYDLSFSANAAAAERVTLSALYNRGIKCTTNELTLRTDNGSQFISYSFEKLCLDEKIKHERIPAHSPNYNAHIESYHRYLQDEWLTGKIYMTLEIAQESIGEFVHLYNTKRIHSSIDYRTPNEFYNLKNNKFKENLVLSI